MVYKLFAEDTEGDYLDLVTGEERNIMGVPQADTPEGLNVGWTEFESEEAMMAAWGVERKPEPEEEEEEELI